MDENPHAQIIRESSKMDPGTESTKGKRRPLVGHDPSFEVQQHRQTKGQDASVWDTYQNWVKKNYLGLELLEDALSRLLFWLPHSESQDSAWREVGYGILSLHRLSMDLALQDTASKRKNAYGTSVRTKESPSIAATSVRIGITAIHSVLPALTSLVAMRESSSSSTKVATAKVRWYMEQVKFLLRIYLLASYWRQQQSQLDAPDCGILLDGGMYRVGQPQEFLGVPWDRGKSLQRRRNYVGERTGWKATMGPREDTLTHNIRTMAADALYTLRPLVWAWFESSKYHKLSISQKQAGMKPQETNHHQLWKGWLLCLAMDLLSLRLIQGKRQLGSKNQFTENEIQRRKMRLLLYALRSPVWSNTTLPLLDTVSRRILKRIPLLGGIGETVLWDWILYYQHPFVSEEG